MRTTIFLFKKPDGTLYAEKIKDGLDSSDSRIDWAINKPEFAWFLKDFEVEALGKFVKSKKTEIKIEGRDDKKM